MSVNYFNLQDRTRTGSKKHFDLGMGTTLAAYIIEDSENKIDSQIYSGLDNTRNKDLKELLYRSDFKTNRSAFGKRLAFDGYIAAVLLYVNNEWMIEHFRVQNAESYATMVSELIVDADRQMSVRVKDSIQPFDLMYRFYKDPETKRIIRETFYTDLESNKQVTSTFTYPSKVKQIPAKIIRNNPSASSDVGNILNILLEMDAMSNDMGPEWEKVKVMFQNRSNMFGIGKSAEVIKQAIENGDYMFDSNTQNNKLASAIEQITGGSVTPDILIRNLLFLEDRALKYSFQGRDMDSSGNNKHNMQVGLFNQAHGEYIAKKIDQRQRDYLRFFKDIVEPITGIKAPASITIQNSIYEQGKIDGMRILQQQVELTRGQALQQKAQADKHLADAEKVEKETAQVGKEVKTEKVTMNEE